MFVAKGQRRIAPVLGFFEVLIWIVAISQIMSNLNNWACYFAYATGFALGNYIGMLVEERLAVGNILVRVITSKEGSDLVKLLSANGFGATTFHAEGSTGSVNIVYSIANRKDIGIIKNILNSFDSKLFYTIEDIRKVNAGIFPAHQENKIQPFTRWRKGK